MGEYADMIIEGETCACGEFIGDAVGYPRFCSTQCEADYGPADDAPVNERPAKTINCPAFPKCERRFRTRQAAGQHWIDKHED